MKRAALALAWPAMLAVLSACAVAPPTPERGRFVESTLSLEGRELHAEWFVPADRPRALITLQHGFARQCRHLRGTAQALMQTGLVTLCLDADMTGGNPALAEALSAALLAGLPAPDAAPLPARVVVAGHSAGALFALRLGQRLVERAPERLAGALLFDPVAASAWDAALAAVSDGGRRPVRVLLAEPHACNAQGSARPGLRALRVAVGATGVSVVQPSARSTHVDAEGSDSGWPATAVCGEPLPGNVAALRGLAAAWASDMAAGGTPPSGTALLESLIATGRVRSVD